MMFKQDSRFRRTFRKTRSMRMTFLESRSRNQLLPDHERTGSLMHMPDLELLHFEFQVV